MVKIFYDHHICVCVLIYSSRPPLSTYRSANRDLEALGPDLLSGGGVVGGLPLRGDTAQGGRERRARIRPYTTDGIDTRGLQRGL